MGFAGHLPELLILLVAALIIFGPKRLPEIGGAMGKGIREFKKSTRERAAEAPTREVATTAENPAQIDAVLYLQQVEEHKAHETVAVQIASSSPPAESLPAPALQRTSGLD